MAPGSIGEELELEPGDRAAYHQTGKRSRISLTMTIMTDSESFVMTDTEKQTARNGSWRSKATDEDLGLTFENGLMSEYRSCRNKCIFCFIDQMPPGMRETLYFKDDDSRLSFLQGNYITLTNMSDRDIDRIIRFHLSPYQHLGPDHEPGAAAAGCSITVLPERH